MSHRVFKKIFWFHEVEEIGIDQGLAPLLLPDGAEPPSRNLGENGPRALFLGMDP